MKTQIKFYRGGVKLDNIAKISIKYTFNKFKVFVPYSLLIVPLACLFNWITQGTSKDTFLNMFLEIFFISRSDKNVGTFWFLNAMFIAFPLFCCFCQIRAKHFVYILSLLYVLLYYEATGVAPLNANYPDNITRAIGGLLLGIVVYGMTEYLDSVNLTKRACLFLTIIEEMLLGFTYILVYMSRTNTKFMLFCMTMGMVLLLSDKTYTSKIYIGFFNWLGRFSMVIFMIHLLIADFMNVKLHNLGDTEITILYYGCTIALGILMYFFVEYLRTPARNLLKKITNI